MFEASANALIWLTLNKSITSLTNIPQSNAVLCLMAMEVSNENSNITMHARKGRKRLCCYVVTITRY
jgi:hypothetical protein